MKPLPIIAGIAVMVVVLAGFAVFLLTSGDDRPGEEAMTADRAGEADRGRRQRVLRLPESALTPASSPDRRDRLPGQDRG